MVYWWLHSRHRGHWPKDQRTGPHRPACKYVCFLMVLDSRCLIQKLKRGSPGGLHVPFLHCIEHRGDAADAWKTLLISSFQMIGIITVRIHCRGLTRAENPNETKWHLIVAYSCIIFASYSHHIHLTFASCPHHIHLTFASCHIHFTFATCPHLSYSHIAWSCLLSLSCHARSSWTSASWTQHLSFSHPFPNSTVRPSEGNPASLENAGELRRIVSCILDPSCPSGLETIKA